MDCFLVQKQSRFSYEFLLASIACEIFSTFVDCLQAEEHIRFFSKFYSALVTLEIWATLMDGLYVPGVCGASCERVSCCSKKIFKRSETLLDKGKIVSCIHALSTHASAAAAAAATAATIEQWCHARFEAAYGLHCCNDVSSSPCCRSDGTTLPTLLNSIARSLYTSAYRSSEQRQRAYGGWTLARLCVRAQKTVYTRRHTTSSPVSVRVSCCARKDAGVRAPAWYTAMQQYRNFNSNNHNTVIALVFVAVINSDADERISFIPNCVLHVPNQLPIGKKFTCFENGFKKQKIQSTCARVTLACYYELCYARRVKQSSSV
ncbi:unnamed protein product, partial [Trichogramma brassicae]